MVEMPLAHPLPIGLKTHSRHVCLVKRHLEGVRNFSDVRYFSTIGHKLFLYSRTQRRGIFWRSNTDRYPVDVYTLESNTLLSDRFMPMWTKYSVDGI